MILAKTYENDLGKANLEDLLNDFFDIPNNLRNRVTKKPGPRIFMHYLLYDDLNEIDLSKEKKEKEDLEKIFSKSVFKDHSLDFLFENSDKNDVAIDILFEISFPQTATNSDKSRRVGAYLSKSINQHGRDKLQGSVSSLFNLVDFNKLSNHLEKVMSKKMYLNHYIDILFKVVNEDYEYRRFSDCCKSYGDKLAFCVLCSLIDESKRYFYFADVFDVEMQTGERAAGGFYSIGVLVYIDSDGIYDYFGDISRSGDINFYINSIINNNPHSNSNDLMANESSLICINKIFKLVDIEYKEKGKDKNLEYYVQHPDDFYSINKKYAYYSFISDDGEWFIKTSADKIRISVGHLGRIFFNSDGKFGFKVWGYCFDLKGNSKYIKPLIISRKNIISIETEKIEGGISRHYKYEN